MLCSVCKWYLYVHVDLAFSDSGETSDPSGIESGTCCCDWWYLIQADYISPYETCSCILTFPFFSRKKGSDMDEDVAGGNAAKSKLFVQRNFEFYSSIKVGPNSKSIFHNTFLVMIPYL